jgi:hypothetical protein
MMKWTMKEKFDKPDTRLHEMTARYAKASIDAGTRIQDLKAELEAVIQKEFKEGKDLSAEKAAKRKALTEAEAAYEYALDEQRKALEYIGIESQIDRITPADLAKDWTEVYRPAVRESRLTPIVERMAAARAEYLSATLQYVELVDEYRPITSATKELVYGYFSNGTHGATPSLQDIAVIDDLPHITSAELNGIHSDRKLPADLVRMGGK